MRPGPSVRTAWPDRLMRPPQMHVARPMIEGMIRRIEIERDVSTTVVGVI